MERNFDLSKIRKFLSKDPAKVKNWGFENSCARDFWPLRARVLGFSLAITFLLYVSQATAQFEPREWTAPRGVGEVAFLGANTLLGALTGGILQELRGGSFQDGFARGALGGAIVYGGKRVASANLTGSGFLGREIAAVGSSVVRNAAEGRPSFERIAFPLGPVRIYATFSERVEIDFKVSAADLVSLTWATFEPNLTFRLGESLSSGVPVFVAEGKALILAGNPVNGLEMGGAVLLSGGVEEGDRHTVFHERVHVLQRDFFSQAWIVPAENWLVKATFLRPLLKVADFNLLLIPFGNAVFSVLTWEERPWEIEAEFMSSR